MSDAQNIAALRPDAQATDEDIADALVDLFTDALAELDADVTDDGDAAQP